jgi:type I restriction enzyme S subunit
LVRLKTNNRTTPEFMNYLLNTSQVLEISRSLALPSINQANLNPTRYGRILIPLPPLPEQIVIAAYLDKETAKLDALVSKVEEAVERLQEYRTALITAAVTGKIDVRKVIKG